MKGFDLFQKFSGIDDKYIIESESYKKKSVIKSFPFIAAACFIVAVSAVLLMMPRDSDKLEVLTIPIEFNSSMGYEGYSAYDIHDISFNNPVGDGSEIEELVVYANKYIKSSFNNVSSPDYEAMQTLLIETAKNLGLDTDNLVIQNNAYTDEEIAEVLEKAAFIPNEEIEDIPDGMEITTLDDGRVHIGPIGEFLLTEYYVESEGIKISVDTTLETTVEFDKSIVQNLYCDDNYEDLAAAATQIIKTLSDFIDMENPQIDVRGGGYNIYGERSYDIFIYEGDESDFDISTNYKFDYIWFMVSEDGSVTKAVKYSTDILKPIASYPIISADEAETLLIQGHYTSTVADIAPEADLILRAELVYRNDSELSIFIPYYMFYVKLPDRKDSKLNLNSYGAYYVPAVESEYIENMPLWNGDFN